MEERMETTWQFSTSRKYKTSFQSFSWANLHVKHQQLIFILFFNLYFLQMTKCQNYSL